MADAASDAVFDVAIVGFGPSGAVAAALLGQAGLKVLVVDRAAEVYGKPRAIALDHEVLRVFQQIGIAEAVEPHIAPFTDSCYYGIDGTLIRRMTMIAPPYPQGHVPSAVFTQPPVEAALRAAVLRLSGVTVRTGHELVGLAQDDEGATLSLREAAGSESSVRARWVIGCDGASSTVRDLVGIRLEDLGFDEPWLVVDVLVNERGLAKLPTTSVQYCEPHRPCSYVMGPANHRRWEISLKDGEDPQRVVEDDQTWALLARWLTPGEGELWRQASYRFHALVADRWRVGRVFLAGDAAHQQPPFLGQGMCQGVRDVANLAWKLGAVLRGAADKDSAQRLLDSYGQERKAHVIALTTRLKEIGAVICERDVDKARDRDRAMLAQAGGKITAIPRQDVLPRLERGALLSTRDSSARGRLAPQPWLMHGDGTRVRMDHLVGTGWRLLLSADAARDDLAEAGRSLALRTLRLGTGSGAHAEAEGVLAAWFDEHLCQAALVRPDHYVFGTASGSIDDIRGLLAEAVSATE